MVQPGSVVSVSALSTVWGCSAHLWLKRCWRDAELHDDEVGNCRKKGLLSLGCNTENQIASICMWDQEGQSIRTRRGTDVVQIGVCSWANKLTQLSRNNTPTQIEQWFHLQNVVVFLVVKVGDWFFWGRNCWVGFCEHPSSFWNQTPSSKVAGQRVL